SARDFKNKFFISKPFRSEVQSNLCVDSSITGARAAAAWSTKTSKRASQSQRLTKTRRRKVPNRRAKIYMIQQILKVDRDVQVVSLLTCRGTATALWSSTCRSRSTTATRSRNCGAAARSTAWSTRTTRRTRSRSVTTIDVSKSKRAADAKVNHKRARRVTKVARNDRLAGQWRQIEVSKTRAPDVLC